MSLVDYRTGPVDAEQHQMTITHRHHATQILECRDTNVETFLLELNEMAVDKSETPVILEVQRINWSVWWERSGSVNASIV